MDICRNLNIYFFNRTGSEKDISDERTCLLLLIFHKKCPTQIQILTLITWSNRRDNPFNSLGNGHF